MLKPKPKQETVYILTDADGRFILPFSSREAAEKHVKDNGLLPHLHNIANYRVRP